MSAVVLRGDAAHLPLPAESVDLIVTSPPFWQLRSYTDAGEHYAGQIGSEETPQEYIAALIRCTREWMRALKPSGSIFVELGDKYAGGGQGGNVGGNLNGGPHLNRTPKAARKVPGDFRPKCLLDLPARYSIACVDHLGLIKRANIVWDHVNGLPESVTDRVRAAHSMVFHFTKQPRYFSAVDEIREAHQPDTLRPTKVGRNAMGGRNASLPGGMAPYAGPNPLGKLPGSVWSIPSAPLSVPAHLGIDHFAAYPPELCRRIILGWSPSGICLECGEGRRPVSMADAAEMPQWALSQRHGRSWHGDGADPKRALGVPAADRSRRITGYACACTPYTDHPGTGERTGPTQAASIAAGAYPLNSGGQPRQTSHPGHAGLWDRPKTGPWREYHFDRWTPPPTRPAVVLDPFCGTGTSMLTASVLGRIGIGVDRSMDYARLAVWRTRDPGERARALGVPKPPPVPEGQGSLFDHLGEAS